MATLTNNRHERFAQELAKGEVPERAFELAGYKAHRQNAHRLMTKDDITARVAELKERAAIKCELTIADLVQELEEARAAARSADTVQASAMVTATMGKAKLLGLVVDKQQDVTPPDDRRDALARRLARLSAGSGKGCLSGEPVH